MNRFRIFIWFVCVQIGSGLAGDASAVALRWANAYGTASQELVEHLVVDNSDAIIIAGRTDAAVSLGGPLLGSDGIPSLLLAKYDSEGAHLWSRAFVGDGTVWSFQVAIEGLAVDESENIIIAGSNLHELDFGGGSIGFGVGLTGFVAIFDAQGNHLSSWILPFDAADVTLDSNGDVVVGASFSGTIDIAGDSVSAVGDTDIILARYDLLGNLIDYSHILDGSSVTSAVTSLASRAGGETVVGGAYYFGTLELGGVPLHEAISVDPFVAVFDSLGGHVWSAAPLLSSNIEPRVATDAAGSVYLTGGYSANGFLFDDPLNNHSGLQDMFLAKLDASGVYDWGIGVGSPGGELIEALTVSADGSVLITGQCGQPIDFGNGPISADPGIQLFVAEYTSAGANVWAHLSASNDLFRGVGVAKDSQGNVTFAARYEGALQLDGEPYASLGLGDILVAEVDPSSNLPLISGPQGPVPTVLNSDVLSVGQVTFANDGDADAGAFRCGYYLSADSMITNDDALLAFVDIGGLAIGAEAVIPPRDLLLPSGLPNAPHYLGFLVDDTELIPEHIKEEHFSSMPFTYFDVGTSLPCAYAQAFVGSFGGGGGDLSGDWAVVGGDEQVQLYRRVASVWQLAESFTPSDGVAGDQYGLQVSMDGDRLAVLSPNHDFGGPGLGAIYCYSFDGSSWAFDEKLIPPAGASFVNRGMVLSGDALAVTKGSDGVLIYRQVSGSWSFEQDVSSVVTGQGSPMDLDGDVLVVGSGFEGVDFYGYVRIYRFNGSAWSLEQTLSASPSVFADAFGHSVAVSGDRIAVAVPPSGTNGSTYVFERQNGTWVETMEFPVRAWEVDLDGPDIVTMMPDGNGSSTTHHHFDGMAWQTNNLDYLTPTGSVGRGASVDQGIALIPNFGAELVHAVELASDCNENGVGDLCEIQVNPSLDADQNGILDSCEATPVDDGPSVSLAGNRLSPAVPNPFNPSTQIEFSIRQQGRVEISIFDVGGRKVRSLVDEVLPAGTHRASWRGRDEAGQRVASGVYLYRMSTTGFQETRRFILLK